MQRIEYRKNPFCITSVVDDTRLVDGGDGLPNQVLKLLEFVKFLVTKYFCDKVSTLMVWYYYSEIRTCVNHSTMFPRFSVLSQHSTAMVATTPTKSALSFFVVSSTQLAADITHRCSYQEV
jgi:hypothetical protein